MKRTTTLLRVCGPSHRRLGRVAAMAIPALGFALLLAVSPATQVHGDFDDDDGQPQRRAPSCPSPSPAPCDCVTAASGPTKVAPYGCAEEYLGDIAGTHWYDVWKKCPLMSTYCIGGLIEGVPYDNPNCQVCTTGEMCDPATCCQSMTKTSLIQTRLANAEIDDFRERGHFPNVPTSLVPTREGFGSVRHNGQLYTFMLYSIVTNYRDQIGETSRVRLIGVQVDPATLGSNQPRRANWSADEPEFGYPSTGSPVDHWIDVELPNADMSRPFPAIETQRFRVTTVTAVDHP